MKTFQVFRSQGILQRGRAKGAQNLTYQTPRGLHFTARNPGPSSRALNANLQRSSRFVQDVRLLFMRRVRQTRHNSSNSRPQPDPTPQLGSPEPSLSLSQRMRKLSREYGWSALGVYFALSALDFPFCFLAVRMLGTKRIGDWEHAIVNTVRKLITYPFPQLQQEGVAPLQGGEVYPKPGESEIDKPGEWNWGVEEATEKAKHNDATLWTQLALAYAIHKSFIFIRVPITAAVTPKVVKVLRGWGWNIGKRRSKPLTAPIKKE